ncbi:hypothetical protein CEXT_274281 [Caerostris extrusa]|uniref:Uncharacterized protein n=1 Tax=Caerostris extrusa TaxID=172846 RepID=A0AAV4XXJ1_CAEEX|nr:hypothetical protein CEXT_274281 [Caerostris extrusa]
MEYYAYPFAPISPKVARKNSKHLEFQMCDLSYLDSFIPMLYLLISSMFKSLKTPLKFLLHQKFLPRSYSNDLIIEVLSICNSIGGIQNVCGKLYKIQLINYKSFYV